MHKMKTTVTAAVALARLAAWRSGWLHRQGVELWVSTPWLQQKYALWQPRLILPSPVTQVGDTRRFFYHGSASHAAEIGWLRPVVEAVLERDERLSFEVVGGKEVYGLYRGLPRVSVVHPMKWPAYQAFLAMSGRHIGLAPLIDTPFNHARSCTKFFDVTRCGAVGIYSSGSVLVPSLLPMAWTACCCHWTSKPGWKRSSASLEMSHCAQNLLRNAEARKMTLSDKAQSVNLDLFSSRQHN